MTLFSRLLTVTFLLGICANVSAEILTFFDIEKCVRYTADNYPDNDEVFVSWLNQAQQMTGKIDETHFVLWSAFKIAEGERIGICGHIVPAEGGRVRDLGFICMKNSLNKFPLSGARFKPVANNQGQIVRYECITGCKGGGLSSLYFESDEPLDSEPNVVEMNKANSEFTKKCKMP